MNKDSNWPLIAHLVTIPEVRSAIIEYSDKHPYQDLYDENGNIYMGRSWVYNPFVDNESVNGGIYPDEPSTRVHWIARADNDRHLHNHPWDATSVIMYGWYKERREDGVLYLRQAGDIVHLNADTFHRIEEVSVGGVWTLFTTYGFEKPWGFNTEKGFIPSREYFQMQKEGLI